MAMNLTVSEYVNEYNIDTLTEIFNRGNNIYPGANYIIKSNGNKYIADNVNTKVEIGDII